MNVLTWVNLLFYLSLLLLMLGGSLYIRQGRFFQAFIYSWKYFFSRLSKQEKIMEEIEGKKGHLFPDPPSSLQAKPIFLIGTILFIISSLLSFLLF